MCTPIHTRGARTRARAHTHTLHPKPYAAQLEVQAIEVLQEEDEALGEYDDDAEDEARPSEGECGEREGEEGEGAEGEGEEWGGEEGEGENGLQRRSRNRAKNPPPPSQVLGSCLEAHQDDVPAALSAYSLRRASDAKVRKDL